MLQLFDLGVERGEAPAGDRLPCVNLVGVEDAIDLVEVEAGVLEQVILCGPADA